MKMIVFMLLALCTTTIPTGYARILVMNDMGESSHMVRSMFVDDKASPGEFSASVTKSSAEDVISVSSVPKESLGDVSVSYVPEASSNIVAPKASPMSIAPKASPMIIAPKASPMSIAPKASPMIIAPKPSRQQFSASVPILSAEDVISVSSVPKESLGDVSVSYVPEASSSIVAPKASPLSIAPKASPMIIAPKASPMSIAPKASPMIIAPKASPMIIAPKASRQKFSASVPILSAEDVVSVSSVPVQSPEPQHISSEEASPGHVSIASEEPSPGHVFIDSVPYTVSEPAPWSPSHDHVSIDSVPHSVSEPDPHQPPSHGHVSSDSVPHTVSEPDPNWPPQLILS